MNWSSSYELELHVYTDKRISLFYRSDNINFEDPHPFQLTGKEYKELKGIDELERYCRGHVEASTYTYDVIGNLNEMLALDMSEVKRIEVYSTLASDELIYETRDSYNYVLHRHDYLDVDKYDEFFDDESGRSLILYHDGKTFEEDIYDEEVEEVICDEFMNYSDEQRKYIIEHLNEIEGIRKISIDDDGRELYESLARLFLNEEYSFEELLDEETYLTFIANGISEYEQINDNSWEAELIDEIDRLLKQHTSNEVEALIQRLNDVTGGLSANAGAKEIYWHLRSRKDIGNKPYLFVTYLREMMEKK